MAYAYNCEIICDDCANKVMQELDCAGCDDSGDTNEYPQYGGDGESDCPEHCGHCGEFIGNDLTSEGEDYVARAVAEDLLAGCKDTVACTVWMAYYHWIDYGAYVSQCYDCGDWCEACDVDEEGLCADCQAKYDCED